jgi:hypothetical protein
LRAASKRPKKHGGRRRTRAMTEPSIVKLIEFFILVVGGGSILWKWIDHMNIRVKERSLGATKVAEIMQTVTKILLDIEQLRAKDTAHDKLLDTLTNDYKLLTQQLFHFLNVHKS